MTPGALGMTATRASRPLELEGHLQGLVGGFGEPYAKPAMSAGVDQVADVDDRVPHQGLGQNLARPLLGSGLVKGGVYRPLEELGRARGLGDVFVEIPSAVAVAAACNHYHNAALGQHGVGRGQALGTLVEVLVERIAAVGYNSYVAIYALYAARERRNSIRPRARPRGPRRSCR